MQNFTPLDYNNKGKIWDIDTAPNGIVYMAADGGLLEYDGITWNSFIGSDGFTRSIHVVSDSLIYTGSDLDFGIWQKNRYQEFEYRSLYPFREDMIDLNEEFWNIHQSGENILFVSDYNIYIFRNDNLTKISAPNRFTDSYSVGDSIYFSDEELGLLQFDDLSLNPVAEFPDGFGYEISAIYNHEEGIVLVTYDSGLFLYSDGNLTRLDTPLSRILENSNVFSFEQIRDNYLAVGTVQKGLYISDLDGNIVHYINRNKGLLNNTILSLHYSFNGQLWMGMDYGVSSLNLNSNLTFIYDFRGDFGTGYTAQLKDDRFYLGTSKGLYTSDWNALNNDNEFYRFEEIPGSEGQVWSLNTIEDELFVAHDRGLFILNNNQLERVGTQQGFWEIIPYEDYLLGGTYNGISIYEKSSGDWTFLKRMDLIRGSTNQVMIERDNILWTNIPNYGVIRAELNDDLNPTDRKIFLKDSFDGADPYIVKNDSAVQVVTDKFEYTYSPEDSSFSTKNEIAFHSGPEEMMPWIYRSVPLNDEYVFFPLYNGFALQSLERGFIENSDSTQLIFRQIEAYNNEESIQSYPGDIISHTYNNVRVEYLVPNQHDVLYRYKLNGSETWSEWSAESGIDLINLDYGDYELSVQAMKNGEIFDRSTLSFRVAPPWYQSWYAYLLYMILIALGIYLLYLWQMYTLKKHEKQYLINKQQSLREQAEKHRQKILQFEQERLQEDYDQLKMKLREKTIELANKAKENEDKNRLIEKLKKKIEKIEQNSESSKTRWNEINKLLDSYSTEEDNTFEIQMDQLHQEFFQRLKNNYPQLSSNDLRLCAYLKLGFNSKEIADFLNIQPSSVYINRSRLRKKLELDTEEDLHDFLNSV
jgi:AraC family transcriptional regulator, chitin signaling transcriptional activator